MTPTTYTAFVNAVSALTITGVTRKYTAPPQSVGDLPCSFPLIPSGGDGLITFSTGGNIGHVMRMDLVIAFEASGQSTNISNFSGCVTIMDNATTALRAMTKPVQGVFSWSMRLGEVPIGSVPYWAVIISLEGYG